VDVVIIALLAAGCAVTVLSSCAMLWIGNLYDRLHLLAPVSSLGAPLIGAALVVQNGWGLTAGQVLLVVVLLAVTGPAVGMATARAAAGIERGGSDEAPE
jgi:multisubunit Na+/H+ antiporter MnhG subunit